MSNKAPKLPKSKKPPKKAKKQRAGISPLAVLVTVATLIGGIAAAVAFYPRVTPTVSDPSDPNDPFSSSVTITNTGLMPLGSVSGFVGLNELHTQNSQGPTYGVYGDPNQKYARFYGPNWKSHYLGLDDRFTFVLSDAFGPGYGEGNLAIIVDYEIPIIHMKREKIFPLISKKRSSGTFYWAFDTQAN
jgi:hypothetical protein